MSLDLNDPRLTAYTLNELDPQERAEVERLLADDPAAQELLRELKETADFLTQELAAEPAPDLTDAQKVSIRNGHVDGNVDVSAAVGRDCVPSRGVTETPHNKNKPPEDKKKNKIIAFPAIRRFTLWGLGIAAAAALALGLSLQTLGSKKTQVFATINSKLDRAMPQESNDLMMVVEAPEPQPAPAPPLAPAKPVGSVYVAEGGSTSVAVSVPSSKGEAVPKPSVQAYSGQEITVPLTPAPAKSKAPTRLLGSQGFDVQDISSLAVNSGKPVSNEFEVNAFKLKREERKVAGAKQTPRGFNTESYNRIVENEFLMVQDNPLSTFSIDVDTASYANMRRFLESGQRPPADAVRIEELINYFPYAYEQPKGDDPFAANVEVAECPWDKEHRLARIGLKGREIARNDRPASNLVFLIDVSGSMESADKLPLVKQSLQLLVSKLKSSDRIAIVVYAGNSGLVLPSTAATPANKDKILGSLAQLEAGGSTNGAEGIQLAYNIARENFIKGGTNRVILCTDGDFNVGVTNQGDLVRLIEEKAKSGVFLSVLGFGTGNVKDSTMVMLADKGNGNYAYIDSIKEGRKVLVEQMGGTLVTIAKDVKIQIEFNPAKVGAYRLIGYEKRMLAKEDFNNDKKDAGEIGAGHTVTALYEIIPAGKSVKGAPAVDPLKYQKVEKAKDGEDRSEVASSDLFTLKIRYKQPDGATSKKLEFPIKDQDIRWTQASGEFKFSASVAAFGMVLRDSPYRGEADYDLALTLARAGKGEDEDGYRSEFIRLIKTASDLSGK